MTISTEPAADPATDASTDASTDAAPVAVDPPEAAVDVPPGDVPPADLVPGQAASADDGAVSSYLAYLRMEDLVFDNRLDAVH